MFHRTQAEGGTLSSAELMLLGLSQDACVLERIVIDINFLYTTEFVTCHKCHTPVWELSF